MAWTAAPYVTASSGLILLLGCCGLQLLVNLYLRPGGDKISIGKVEAYLRADLRLVAGGGHGRRSARQDYVHHTSSLGYICI